MNKRNTVLLAVLAAGVGAATIWGRGDPGGSATTT